MNFSLSGSRRLTVFMMLCLTGCNSPKLSHQNEVPRFSSEEYQHLDCQQLKNKIDKLQLTAEKLSGVDNESRYVLHTDMPLVGTGDSMGAVELLRVKAERNSIQTVYGQKDCQSRLGKISHNQ